VVVPTIAVSGETGETTNTKPPPMLTTIPINGVPAKSLIDSGSSDDFMANHFVTTNRVSVQRHEKPLSIQQAVRGSKPKSNATAMVNMQFGEWTMRAKAYTAGLAGYDAIIGVPTLTAGGAVIDVKNRKVHFKEWDVTLDCEIPEALPRVSTRRTKTKKTQKNARTKPELVRNSKKSKTDGREKNSKENLEGKIDRVASVTLAAMNLIGSEANWDLPKQNTSNSNGDGTTNVRMDGNPAYYRELLLSEFDDILVDELPNELPPLRDINHRIPYKPTKPWIAHKYRLPEAHKRALEEDVKAKLKSGILRYTSEIPLAASHMVPKKENKLRHVQDL
jgi:hypothetical protein